MKIKWTLWYIKRWVLGFFQNKFDKILKVPENIQSFTIGKTVKWLPITCFKIWNGSIKILYVSGIHVNEVGTVKLAYNIINWANNNIGNLNKYSLFVIPCLNRDWYGIANDNPDYFNGWKVGRFNANNVDLNRNFNTPSFKNKSTWSFWKDYSENIEVYCWEIWNSEPETQALNNFTLTNEIKILFMFHNVGKDVTGNKNDISQKLTKIYAKTTWFRLIDEENWEKLNQSGTAKEWCEINNIAYIEVEGSTRYWSDWGRQKSAIEATLFTIN